MKRVLFIPFLFMLSGCPGGKPAPHPRSVYINGERLCFSVDKKDILNYYRIESDQKDEYNILKYGDRLNLSYPDACINFKWMYGYTYVISYGLNGHDFVYGFFIDNNGRLTALEH